MSLWLLLAGCAPEPEVVACDVAPEILGLAVQTAEDLAEGARWVQDRSDLPGGLGLPPSRRWRSSGAGGRVSSHHEVGTLATYQVGVRPGDEVAVHVAFEEAEVEVALRGALTVVRVAGTTVAVRTAEGALDLCGAFAPGPQTPR